MTVNPCPYVAPDGHGPCTLPDLAQLHQQAVGLSMHLCSTDPEPASPSARADWRSRRLFSYATSKRDAGRWAHQDVGQLCRRTHPDHGVPCTLPDTRDVHEYVGHWAPTVSGHWSWRVDLEDVRRWEPPVVLHLLDGMPEHVTDGVPYPPTWAPEPGDYPFCFLASTWIEAAGKVPSMRRRAEATLRGWGRRPRPMVSGVLVQVDRQQWAVWYRTQPDPAGPVQHRYHRGRAWTSPPGTPADDLTLWKEVTGP